MGVFYSIRGTNGSGKSTLARGFTDKDNSLGCELSSYPAPTRKEPDRYKRVPGYLLDESPYVGVVGSYETPTGGMDGIPTFKAQQDAIRYMLDRVYCEPERAVPHVIGEGVLASTVFGSWSDFDRLLHLGGHTMAWVYLDTPIEVCLARIKERQRAAGKEREIKEDQVRDKVRAIAATRLRAIAAGYVVYDLPWNGSKPYGPSSPEQVLWKIINGEGESYRAR